jgi:glycosyltransferase involved in cell wall biosynthesis
MGMVSIIVLFIRREADRSLRSIGAEPNLPGLELLLLDDAQPTAAGKFVTGCGNDKRIRVFHQENKGVSEARNAGIMHAGGGLILHFWTVTTV